MYIESGIPHLCEKGYIRKGEAFAAVSYRLYERFSARMLRPYKNGILSQQPDAPPFRFVRRRTKVLTTNLSEEGLKSSLRIC